MPVEPVRNRFPRLALSPGGTRIAIEHGGDIWIKELSDGPFCQFTSQGGSGPTWSPDGRSIAFNSRRIAISDLFVRPTDGSEQAELLQDGDGVMASVSYSPDGRWFVYNEDGTVYASEVGADVTERRSVVTGTGDGVNLAVSPNARWIAYESAEAGMSELAIVPSPFTEVSAPTLPVGPGSFPVWSRSGDELFYRSAEGFMMTRRVSGEASLILGSPQVLFSMEGYVGGFDVDLDAQRFAIVRQPPGARPVPSLIVVQNFFAELERLVPN